jgi:hypothetical protein
MCHRNSHDAKFAHHYIGRSMVGPSMSGPAMYDPDQIRYFDQVLGSSLRPIVKASGSMVNSVPNLIVFSPEPETSDAQDILQKLFSKLGVSPDQICFDQGGVPDSALLPRNALFFTGTSTVQMESIDGKRLWHLPKISELVGVGDGVNEKKRQVWTLLQEMKKALDNDGADRC